MADFFLNMTGTIIDDEATITFQLMKQFAEILNQELPKCVKPIEKEVIDVLEELIIRTDTYQSILTGQLQQEFGIRDSEVGQKLDGIVEILISSVHVNVIPIRVSKNGITGGLKISAIYADFQDILSTYYGQVQTDKGETLNWLEWLLIEGDRIVISDHVIKDSYSMKSRAGLAVMVKSRGGFWKVPSKYSGTISNNWFTRMIDKDIDKINRKISEIVTRNLQKVI